jgi:hypothetical protein
MLVAVVVVHNMVQPDKEALAVEVMEQLTDQLDKLEQLILAEEEVEEELQVVKVVKEL